MFCVGAVLQHETLPTVGSSFRVQARFVQKRKNERARENFPPETSKIQFNLYA
jgi:hypothetical protein